MHHVAGRHIIHVWNKSASSDFTCIKIPQLFISDCLTCGWMLWNVCFLAWDGHHFVIMLLPYAGHRAKANLNSERARQLSLWGYKKFLRKNFGVKSFKLGFLFCLLIYQTSRLLTAPTFAGCYMLMCHALQLITPAPVSRPNGPFVTRFH